MCIQHLIFTLANTLHLKSQALEMKQKNLDDFSYKSLGVFLTVVEIKAIVPEGLC